MKAPAQRPDDERPGDEHHDDERPGDERHDDERHDDERPGDARSSDARRGERHDERADERSLEGGQRVAEPLEAWLWDPSEAPGDPLAGRLDAALSGARFEPARAPLRLPPRHPARRARPGVLALVAAALLVVALPLAVWRTRAASPGPALSLALVGLARVGAPGPCEGELGLAFVASAPVRCGEGRPTRLGRLPASRAGADVWLEVPAGARARVLLERGIGHVDAHEGARLRALPSRGEGQALDLDRGTLYAKVSAPPRIFQVSTPGARVVDLGCEYSLTSRGRDLELYVVSGYVELANERGQVLVPALHRSTITQGGRPGVPLALDAHAALVELVAQAEAGAPPSTLLRGLGHARRADVLTLFELLGRLGPDRREERAQVARRIATLAPLAEAPRVEAALAGDLDALLAWRTALSWALFDGSTLARPAAPR
jgi:hypothetical protein